MSYYDTYKHNGMQYISYLPTSIILRMELGTWFRCSEVLSVVTGVGSGGGVSLGGGGCQAERK